MFIVGIDPGMSGGMAVIPLYAFAQTRIYPITSPDEPSKGKCTLWDMSEILKELSATQQRVEPFLENPSLPMTSLQEGGRNFNVQAHRKLGRSVGQWEGLLIANNLQHTLLTPQKWQNALNCRTGGNKRVTLDLAQKIYPFLSRTLKTSSGSKSTVTHAVADALLIALYGYLLYADVKYIPASVRQNVPIPIKSRKDINHEQIPTTTGLSDGYGPLCSRPSKRRTTGRSQRP